MATKQMPHGTHGFDRRPLQISRPAQADDVISRHQALPYPKPLSASRVTAAFGNLAASKFTRLLDHPDNQVVEDDLRCIEQHVLGHSSRATLLLHCNGVNVIANLLSDSRRNTAVKVAAGRCLVCIAECEAVREALAPQPIVVQLLQSVAALREEAQAHAAAALASLCHLKPACEQLDSRVNQAIAAVSEFGQHCAPLCLVLLRMLSLESSRDKAVEQGLLPICARILREAADASALSFCAQIVFRATIPSAYKTLALQAGVLQSLVPLLSHASDDVARSAAEAVSIMSVDISVKKEALSLNCSTALQQLLLRSPSVQLAACQCILVVAEAGRAAFAACIPHTDALASQGDNEKLRDTATRLGSLLRWCP